MAIYGRMNGGTDTDTTRNFGEVKPSHRKKSHKKMNRMNSSKNEAEWSSMSWTGFRPAQTDAVAMTWRNLAKQSETKSFGDKRQMTLKVKTSSD